MDGYNTATKHNVPFKETEEWEKGHSGEKLIAQLKRGEGYHVIPSYDYSGADDDKAPRLQGERQSHIIPDLDISKDGVRIWIEVKVKKSADYTRKTQQNEHGISRRLYNDYLRVAQITGTEVWLYIIEEDTGDILRVPIDSLAKVKRIYDGPRMDPGGMVFFPQASFEIWKTIKPKKARGNNK